MKNRGESTEGGTGIKIGGHCGLLSYVVAGLMMGGIERAFMSPETTIVEGETGRFPLRDFCGSQL